MTAAHNFSGSQNTRHFPWPLIALLASIAALGTHAYLALQNYELKAGLAEKSLCNINSMFNCDAVALSPFAQFLGIPIAIWGALTNAVLAVFLLIYMVNLSRDSDRIERMMFWLSAVVVLATLVMGTISTFFLSTYCIFCIVTYALSFVQFLSIYFFQTTSPFQNLLSDIKEIFAKQVWIVVLLAVIPAGSVLAHSMLGDSFGLRYMKTAVQESLFDWQKSEIHNFTTDGLRYKVGSAPTKMVIVEFADFLCSHCKHAAPTLKNFVETREDIELIFKPFPLDGSCNSADGKVPRGDGLRCQVAAAVLCADSLVGKGWVAHDYFFDRQEKLSLAGFPKNIEELGALTGAGQEALQGCLNSEEIVNKVTKTAQEGRNAKIQGTPSFFVNGKQLPRGQYFPILDAVHKQITGQ